MKTSSSIVIYSSTFFWHACQSLNFVFLHADATFYISSCLQCTFVIHAAISLSNLSSLVLNSDNFTTKILPLFSLLLQLNLGTFYQIAIDAFYVQMLIFFLSFNHRPLLFVCGSSFNFFLMHTLPLKHGNTQWWSLQNCLVAAWLSLTVLVSSTFFLLNLVEFYEYSFAGFDIGFSLHKLPAATFLNLSDITKAFQLKFTISSEGHFIYNLATD